MSVPFFVNVQEVEIKHKCLQFAINYVCVNLWRTNTFKRMKNKILGRLKQEYSHLGLGDAILTAQAESLANSGLVTDENIETVVTAQKTFLEGLQKSNDSRVNEAVKKAKETAKKEFEEAAKKAKEEADKKAADELAKKEKEEAEKKAAEEKRAAENNEPEWFKAYVEKMEAAQAEKAKEYEGLMDKFNKLQEDYDGAKAEAKKKARGEFINSKAKELGIPQYRIDEGFVLAEDADDETITTKLTEISNNIKANSLPADKRRLMGDDKPDTSEVKSIAKALVR